MRVRKTQRVSDLVQEHLEAVPPAASPLGVKYGRPSKLYAPTAVGDVVG